MIASVDAGRIPASIYSDSAIFALERDRLFPRAWQFLAHESEIPNAGAFIVRASSTTSSNPPFCLLQIAPRAV